jgi:hypothetical protein
LKELEFDLHAASGLGRRPDQLGRPRSPPAAVCFQFALALISGSLGTKSRENLKGKAAARAACFSRLAVAARRISGQAWGVSP